MQDSNAPQPHPLDGIVVLDFATDRAELAGRLLGDLGAQVIKFEPPGGAAARRIPPFDSHHAKPGEDSLYWAAVAAGKQSVVLDITDAAARARLQPLLARADVIIESGDPGEMAGLGLGYADIAAANPRVVYASITPFGQTGPDALSPATDLTLEAAGGLLGLQGDGDRPPVPVGYPQASFHAGAQAAADVVIALNEREHSGRGQHLDVSMQAAIVWTLMNATGYPPNTGGDPPMSGEQRSLKGATPGAALGIPPIWECKDGYLTCLVTGGRAGRAPLQTILGWAAAEGELPSHIKARDWSTWATDVAAGALPLNEAVEAVRLAGQYFARHTQHELMQQGTDAAMLLAPVFDVTGLLSDPQLAARNYWTNVDGRTMPGIPVRLSRTPMYGPRPAPRLGEHQHLLDTPLPATPPVSRPTSSVPRRRTFEGIKVADFAWVGVGPIMSKALADHGATVIHVESFTRPDLLRNLPPFKDGVPGLDRAQFMADFNTSKLGLNLDLQTPGGREIARRLIDWSDVVVESFTAGAFARLGFGYEELAKERRELIMMSTCLRGQTGPQRTFGGYGSQGAALAGLFSLTGWPDRAPTGPWGAYTDFIAPRYGVAAFAAALYDRERTGLGQHLDLSQVEAAIHFMEPAVLDYTVNGVVAGPQGHASVRACPHGVYATAGTERYIAIACETPQQWANLRAIAPLDTFADPGLADVAARLPHDAAIDAVLAAWCAGQGGAELAARLKLAGVPASLVLRPTDLYSDAQLDHREFFVTCDHKEMGPTPYDGPVTRFSETPPQLTAAPCLGEHTLEVLRDILGYSDDEIVAFAEAGALS